LHFDGPKAPLPVFLIPWHSFCMLKPKHRLRMLNFQKLLKPFFVTMMACLTFGAQAQVGVTVTGAANTTPALASTYTSLASAITALNAATAFSGPVVLTCASGSETAPSGGYSISYTGATSTANNVNIIGTGVTITAPNPAGTAGNLNDALIKIIGSDFITIQGFTLNENSLNTTTAAATNNMVEWGIALLYASVTDGSQNVTLQNNTITLNKTYPNTYGIYANATHSATAPSTSATATGLAGGNHNLKYKQLQSGCGNYRPNCNSRYEYGC
jgi:hypothetical protein